jgi:hypothetical protein
MNCIVIWWAFKASPEVISAKLATVKGITEKQGYYMLEGT